MGSPDFRDAGRMTLLQALIDGAVNRDDLVTLTLVGVISQMRDRPEPYRVPLAGLDREGFAHMLRHRFGAIDPCLAFTLLTLQRPLPDTAGADEFVDVLQLLREHLDVSEATDPAAGNWLCVAMATACMGANHLWQDMGLPSRRELNEIFTRYFPELRRRNAGDMKWKKFLYRQLCEKAEVLICRSPSCAVCTDYDACFGPEEAKSPAGAAGPSLLLTVAEASALR